MKNNKGFTLTELIAAITIISILMVITIPSINKIMKNSREHISSITKKNIEESAKLFGEEVYMCDQTSDIISVLNNSILIKNIQKNINDEYHEGINSWKNIADRYLNCYIDKV